MNQLTLTALAAWLATSIATSADITGTWKAEFELKDSKHDFKVLKNDLYLLSQRLFR
jgi:hypothetical protein